jgi:hypothetical protein
MVIIDLIPFLLAVVVLASGVCLFLMTSLSTGRRWPGYVAVAALVTIALWLGSIAVTP